MSESFLYVFVVAVDENDQAKLVKNRSAMPGGMKPMFITDINPVQVQNYLLQESPQMTFSLVDVSKSELDRTKQAIQLLWFSFPAGSSRAEVMEHVMSDATKDLRENCRHYELRSFSCKLPQ